MHFFVKPRCLIIKRHNCRICFPDFSNNFKNGTVRHKCTGEKANGFIIQMQTETLRIPELFATARRFILLYFIQRIGELLELVL